MIIIEEGQGLVYPVVIGILSALLIILLLLLLLLLLCQRQHRVKKADKSSSTDSETCVTADYSFPVDTAGLLLNDELAMVNGKSRPLVYSNVAKETDTDRASMIAHKHDSARERNSSVEEIQNPVYNRSSNVYVTSGDVRATGSRGYGSNGDVTATGSSAYATSKDAAVTSSAIGVPTNVVASTGSTIFVPSDDVTKTDSSVFVPSNDVILTGSSIFIPSNDVTPIGSSVFVPPNNGGATSQDDVNKRAAAAFGVPALSSRGRTQSVYSDCKEEESIEHSMSFESIPVDHPSLISIPSASDCHSLDDVDEPIYASVRHQDTRTNNNHADIYVGIATIFPSQKMEDDGVTVGKEGDKPVETVDSPYSTIQHGSSLRLLRPLASLVPRTDDPRTESAVTQDVEDQDDDDVDGIHIDLSHLLRDQPGRERQYDTESQSDRISSLMLLDSVIAEQDEDIRNHVGDCHSDAHVPESPSSTASNALDKSMNESETPVIENHDNAKEDNALLQRQSNYSSASSCSDGSLPTQDGTIINKTFFTKKGPVTML